MSVQQVAPIELAALQRSASPPLIIDVREPWEHAIARIEGAQLMPLGGFYEWSSTLDKSRDYVVMCHHGARSDIVCQALVSIGFQRVRNLAGGIDAWSRSVDPGVPRY